jgi:hypothetical protein
VGVQADEFTRGYGAWMLFMLMLMNALNLADRQGLAAVAPGAEAALSNACATASAHGIRFAMAAVVFLLLWGSFHYFLAARTLRADLDARFSSAASAI